MNRTHKLLVTVILLSGLISIAAFAGELNAPAASTDPVSAMFTLEDLYNRLLSGAAGSKRGGAFTEPTAGPGSTMHNLNEIMNKAPAVDAQGAGNAQVLTGKKFWGLTSGQWGVQTGTMINVSAQNLTPGAASQTITAGYHDGTGKVGGDPSLVSANIKAGTAIFGVAGDANVVNTASGDATNGELMAGKKAWVDGAEVTGTLATKSISNATTTVEAGFYTGTTLSAIDTDLTLTNIKAGTTIFGISGSPSVVDTSTGNATAGEILLGRKAWANGTEITGNRCGGKVLKAGGTFSPGGRWYDNGDGTIVDTTTGLIWLKNVGGVTADPVVFCASNSLDLFVLLESLENGVAGLTDGSARGDWRVPTSREMTMLTSGNEEVLKDTTRLFTGIADRTYWTLTRGTTMSLVKVFSFATNSFGERAKNITPNTGYVMPVRSGY